MNVRTYKDPQAIGTAAAALFSAKVIEKPHAVLGLATGSTPIPTYTKMAEMYACGAVDFSGVTTYNLDEYVGLGHDHPQSYYYFMMDNLFRHINVPESSIHVLSGTASDSAAECAAYEKAIEAAGGIDLQILGIGRNGHIAFNEPADAFAPVITEKVESYGSEMLEITYAPDDLEMITEKILDLKAKGADVIFTTGGMSVDPDDLTPTAIKNAGADIVIYGASALPGAMFMMAYLDEIPILGVPACGMFFRTTVVDLLLPRVFADEKITRRDITSLGVGGLCMQCEVCVWPKCTFGK